MSWGLFCGNTSPQHAWAAASCESTENASAMLGGLNADKEAVQVVYGAIAALGGAFVCSCTRIWSNGLKRMLAVLITGLALMWLGLK